MNVKTDIENSTKRIDEKASQYELKNKKIQKQIGIYLFWTWTFIIVGFLTGILGAILYYNQGDDFNLYKIGDFVGGSVASLWSLAGLFLIFVAFLGQKQQLLNQQIEIKYNQLELRYTRSELEGQKEEMIKQNETLQKQQFENTFFQLLSVQNQIIESMDLRNTQTDKIIAQGRDCFKRFYKALRNSISDININNGGIRINSRTAKIEDTLKAYDKVFGHYQSDLGHYFRNLYHIIKFVHQAKIENKKRYTNFVRAQLSSYELAIIFYNGLSPYGRKKFKPLIEEYSLLKNLNHNLIFNKSDLDIYDPKALDLKKITTSKKDSTKITDDCQRK